MTKKIWLMAFFALVLFALPVIVTVVITLLDWAGPVYGQERPDAQTRTYYIYRDQAGKIILSNLAAADRPLGRAPGDLTVVKQYDWTDASDAEIAATERSNQAIARTNALNTLAQETAALARATDRLAQATGNRQQATVEINAPDIVVQTSTVNRNFHSPHRGRR